MVADRTRKATASSSGSKAGGKKPAKKTPGASAKKAAARKAPAKEPAEKTPAQKSVGAGQPRKSRASAPRAESKPRRSAAEVADRAVQQLTRLTGRRAEGVTGVERNEDGWQVTVEVLELRRIPETTDVLARYEIDTDDNGDLTAYRRAGRYTRGSARED